MDSDSNPDLRFLVVITPLLFAWPAVFVSGFGLQAAGFGFGFKKIVVDSDSAGFGFEVPGFGYRFGFEMPGFAHH